MVLAHLLLSALLFTPLCWGSDGPSYTDCLALAQEQLALEQDDLQMQADTLHKANPLTFPTEVMSDKAPSLDDLNVQLERATNDTSTTKEVKVDLTPLLKKNAEKSGYEKYCAESYGLAF